MRIDIPEDAQSIITTLEDFGFEALIAGGAVRDSLMNRIPHDWDICTNATPEQTLKVFKNTVSMFGEWEIRTTDTGLAHGTVTIYVDGEDYEVTTYRVDGEYSDNRHADSVSFVKNLLEDLSRRDFTINAMAYSHESGLIDPFNGLQDIQDGIIRAVGDPNTRFQEDALRMMRTIRFAAKLGFEIEETTYQAIIDNAELIRNVSMERITSEFLQIIESDNPQDISLLFYCGIMKFLVPMLRIDEQLHKISECSETNVRLAFVFNTDHKNLMEYMKFPSVQIQSVLNIRRGLQFGVCNDREGIRRMLNFMGKRVFFQVLRLRTGLGQDMSWQDSEARDIFRFKEPYCLSDLAINGRNLIELGMDEGQEIGEMLDYLLETVIVAPETNTVDDLVRIVEGVLENE